MRLPILVIALVFLAGCDDFSFKGRLVGTWNCGSFYKVEFAKNDTYKVDQVIGSPGQQWSGRYTLTEVKDGGHAIHWEGSSHPLMRFTAIDGPVNKQMLLMGKTGLSDVETCTKLQ